MIFRSPWNRKFLPGGEEDRLLFKNDQDACGKITTTPLKMTNVGIAQALFDPRGDHTLSQFANIPFLQEYFLQRTLT